MLLVRSRSQRDAGWTTHCRAVPSAEPEESIEYSGQKLGARLELELTKCKHKVNASDIRGILALRVAGSVLLCPLSTKLQVPVLCCSSHGKCRPEFDETWPISLGISQVSVSELAYSLRARKEGASMK